MQRIFKTLVLLVLSWQAITTANAFSLRGPKTPWMTQRIGYPPALLYGPMSIGEEYRWNVKTLYYGCTSDFLNYFGERGAVEVDKAVAILNELPSMDDVKMDDYPLESGRMNHRAQALGLRDLKSTALSTMTRELGLDSPVNWVYTLRARFIGVPGFPTNYFVIKRNFDPVTWQHSSYINGVLYTYNFIADGDIASIVLVEAVDPLALGGVINLPVASIGGFAGHFWTGFTRDDIGGLRYIYRSSNVNMENPPTNSFRAALGGGSSTSGSSPWGIPTIPGAGTPTTIPGASTNFVATALRPGVVKITFSKITADSVVGFYPSNNVSWTDTYITNNRTFSQNLIRPQTKPDFLFDGADMTGDDTAGPPSFAPGAVAVVYTIPAEENGDEINGEGQGDRGAGAPPNGNYGPGVMSTQNGLANQASRLFVFNTVGPMIQNIYPNPVGFNSEAGNAGVFVNWGSFDGSTDEPFIYPYYTSLVEYEQQVMGGGGSSSPTGGASSSGLSPWTPVVIPVPVQSTGTGTGTTP